MRLVFQNTARSVPALQNGDRATGDVHLSRTGCRGCVDGIELDVGFELSARSIGFAPAWLHKVIPHIPLLRSRFGAVTRGQIAGHTYDARPLVYSTYPVGRIERARWVLVSAMQFPDSDLALEITATSMLGSWITGAYVYFQGAL